jgi:cobalt/nickel transport system permease protein
MLFALHIPDHTLSAELAWATGAVVAVAAIAGLIRSRATSPRPSVLLLAAVLVLLFAVQLANFPLLDGSTSGHVLGAAAAVLLLGPRFGAAAMALVLVVQAALLGDGGVTALGANLLNMAIIAPAAAAVVAGFVRRHRSDAVGTIAAAGLAGWTSTVVAAFACAVELAMSGVGSIGEVVASLVGQHALLGVVEAAFTAAVVSPLLLPAQSVRRTQLASLGAVAAAVFVIVPMSSELPDTLEVVLAAHADGATR